MSDEQYRLEVRKRDKNEPPNSLRQRGLTPGVVYGPDIENMLLAVDNEDLEDLLAQITRSSRVELNLNGESLETFIREIQYNDLTDEVIHIDFYQPNLDQPMEMDIPVIIQGEAEGEREGGILHRITNTISVKGLPTDIPEAIYVNISTLEIGDVIHLGDLDIEGVQILTPPGRAVLTIAAPLTEEEIEEITMGMEEEVPVVEEEVLEGLEGEEELEEGEEPEVSEPEQEMEEGETGT